MNPEKTQILWVNWALLLVVLSSKSMLCIAFILFQPIPILTIEYLSDNWTNHYVLCLMSIVIAQDIALCLADDQRCVDNLVCWRLEAGVKAPARGGQVMRLTIVEMKVKVPPSPLSSLCLVWVRDDADDKVLFVLALELWAPTPAFRLTLDMLLRTAQELLEL